MSTSRCTTRPGTSCSGRSTPARCGRLRGPGLHRSVRRPGRPLRPDRPTAGPLAVHDEWTRRSEQAVLELRRGLDDGDPTGSYYRYAFETGNFQFFPDYPKYGVWTDAYVLTTREFGPTVEYGIGVYALEKNKMVNGGPGPCSELLPRRERSRHSPARRRRASARGHRREAEAEDRHGDPDRRDAGRQRDRLRRARSTPSTSGT